MCPTLPDSSQDPDCIRGSSEITDPSVYQCMIMPTGYMKISPLILNSAQIYQAVKIFCQPKHKITLQHTGQTLMRLVRL
jgi:hypothetical protein